MPDNPYTRTKTITITEIVPDKEELPYCSAWRVDGTNCPFRGRYLWTDEDGSLKPVCGQHLGKPNTIWIPERKET